MKRLIYLGLLCISMLNAAIVDTDKEVYVSNEEIIASFSELEAEASEWMAVYPAESNNDFGNIIQWKLTDANVEGEVTFNGLNVGTYEIRLFNSANFVIAKQFLVDNDPAIVTTVETTQDTYLSGEPIVAVFNNMSAHEDDWIGIYPAGSNNDWVNMLEWEWIEDGVVDGTQIFDAMPAGDYEVRVFFNNSFNTEASYAFSVEANVNVATVKTTKDIYLGAEEIVAVFENMSGNADDWIGIYPAGSTNDWANMLQWEWIEDGVLDGTQIFDAMPAGDYEVRVFFNNSLNDEATYAFKVEAPVAARILYDDFEDGIDPRWVRHSGRAMTLLNVGAIDGAVGNKQRQVQINGQHSLRTYLGGGYYFLFEQPDIRLKFLEIDMKIGVSSHRFNFGVKVRTALGNRKIEFSSWLNHTLPNGRQIIRGPYGNVLVGHSKAFTTDNYIHLHPAPSDFYVGTSGIGGGRNMFVNYKINLEEKLKLIEPNNELLEIISFTTNGGDYDNLALSPE